jgi:predicted phage-related endonuclease
MLAAPASSSCDQPNRARAALIWRIDTFSIDLVVIMIDTFSIELVGTLVPLYGEIAMSQPRSGSTHNLDRRSFIGGSDARIIMGNDEAMLVRLWREKRGEVEPEDLSDNLIVQLGLVTEDLNRRWYERITGHAIKDVQRRVNHPVIRWMAATLDGLVDPGGAVFEAKFMLPWTFSEEAAAEKHMAQLQHNMWVANTRSAALSIITGSGKWVQMSVHADPLYQHLLLTAEKKFWRCVISGEEPRLFGVEPPRPRLEAVRIVDMSASNSWAEFAAVFRRTRPAFVEHEAAKADLKKLVPEDAKEAVGHGLRAKRSKSGAVSFDVMDVEAADASLQ